MPTPTHTHTQSKQNSWRRQWATGDRFKLRDMIFGVNLYVRRGLMNMDQHNVV